MTFSVFDIAASGMHAQRVKMDTISSNIANINTTRNAKGEKEVYRKKEVTFQEVGVKKGLNFPKGNAYVEFEAPDEPKLIGGIGTDRGNDLMGVMVSKIEDGENPTKIVYDPSHPDADENGFLEVPNVNIVEEMVNMVNASRTYEANVSIAQTTKSMIQSAINI